MSFIENIINNYKVIEYVPFNIYVIEDIVDYEFCDKYIKLINETKLKNTEKDDNYKVVKCDYIDINRYDKELQQYDLELYKVYHKIFKLIKKQNEYIPINGDTYYILRKIYGQTEKHIDMVRATDSNCFYNQIRSLSAVINLNDNYDGGEFVFPYQNISVKLKKGSVILFPPFWTHPHSVNNIGINQFRYTITTWATENILDY